MSSEKHTKSNMNKNKSQILSQKYKQKKKYDDLLVMIKFLQDQIFDMNLTSIHNIHYMQNPIYIKYQLM